MSTAIRTLKARSDARHVNNARFSGHYGRYPYTCGGRGYLSIHDALNAGFTTRVIYNTSTGMPVTGAEWEAEDADYHAWVQRFEAMEATDEYED